MRQLGAILLFGFFVCTGLHAQKLSPADVKLLQTARSHYYDAEEHGLVSFKCSAHFDFSTVPVALLPEDAAADRSLLSATEFSIESARSGPRVTHTFPKETNVVAQQAVTPATNWLTSILSGFFMTWPSKAIYGPIPPFEKWVDNISPMQNGYTITARSSDGLQGIELDKDLFVERVVSVDGTLDEHPKYTQTADGLVFSGLNAVYKTREGQPTEVSYEIESALVDGLYLPSRVHMKVNDNVDVRFTMADCTVVKGVVLKVKPN